MDDTLERLILSGIVGVSAVSKDGSSYESSKLNPFGIMEHRKYTPSGTHMTEIADLDAQKKHIQGTFMMREVSIWASAFDLEKLWD